jgi:hypothetical protein
VNRPPQGFVFFADGVDFVFFFVLLVAIRDNENLHLNRLLKSYFRRLKPAATKTERIDFACGSCTLEGAFVPDRALFQQPVKIKTKCSHEGLGRAQSSRSKTQRKHEEIFVAYLVPVCSG